MNGVLHWQAQEKIAQDNLVEVRQRCETLEAKVSDLTQAREALVLQADEASVRRIMFACAFVCSVLTTCCLVALTKTICGKSIPTALRRFLFCAHSFVRCGQASLAEKAAQLASAQKASETAQQQLDKLCIMVKTQDKLNAIDKAAYARMREEAQRAKALKTEVEVRFVPVASQFLVAFRQ